jgi:predicted phosphodiesterase
MKIAVVSDIHSNLEAVEAVGKAIGELGVDAIYFVGDVVGYGPDPNACTRWVMENVDLAVMGNHDIAALGRIDIDNFNLNAKEAIIWNSEQMEDWATDYITTLPMLMSLDGVTIVHANPQEPESWNYIFSLWDAERNFSHFETTFCFVGHSHQPVTVGMDDSGQVSVLPGDSFTVDDGTRYLVNVGSVGQPRDGNPEACFGLLDTDKGEFSILRSPYEFKITQEKMISAGLPKPLADRLAEGR